MSPSRNGATMYQPSANASVEVDRVAGYWRRDIVHCENNLKEEYYHSEAELNDVGQGSICHRCGRVGHYAKDCGTQKGKEEGE